MSSTRSHHPKLWISRLLLVVALFGCGSAVRAAETPDGAYQKAVTAYIDAAANQINAIRAQADAEAKIAAAGVKEHYTEVYRRLDQCDKLIGQLKSADSSDFDNRKKEFETALRAATAALEEARKRD